MKKTVLVALGFMFCVAVPALAENYRSGAVRIAPVLSAHAAIRAAG